MGHRFDKVLSLIENGTGIVDVGTDHGYIPIKLALSDYIGNIIATDINKSPLQKAKLNAIKFGIEQRIEFQLCNGLDNCNPDLVDTIVICGMGGDLICDILDKAEWTMNSKYKLILQPMSKIEVLRYWLVNNGYEVCLDDCVFDNGRGYSLLVSRYSGVNTKYSDAELFVGKNPNTYMINKVLKGLRKIPSNNFYLDIIEELENYDCK